MASYNSTTRTWTDGPLFNAADQTQARVDMLIDVAGLPITPATSAFLASGQIANSQTTPVNPPGTTGNRNATQFSLAMSQSGEAGWNNNVVAATINVSGTPQSNGQAVAGTINSTALQGTSPGSVAPYVASEFSALVGEVAKSPPAGGYPAGGPLGAQTWALYLATGLTDNVASGSAKEGPTNQSEWDFFCNGLDNANYRCIGSQVNIHAQTPLSAGGWAAEAATAFVYTGDAGAAVKTFHLFTSQYTASGLDFRYVNPCMDTLAAAAAVGATTLSVNDVLLFTSSGNVGTGPNPPPTPSNPSHFHVGTPQGPSIAYTGFTLTSAGSTAGTLTLASPLTTAMAAGTQLWTNAAALWLNTGHRINFDGAGLHGVVMSATSGGHALIYGQTEFPDGIVGAELAISANINQTGAGNNIATTGTLIPGPFTVATLPMTSIAIGSMAFATDGRCAGEAAGAGSGCLVHWKSVAGTFGWYPINTTTAVAA